MESKKLTLEEAIDNLDTSPKSKLGKQIKGYLDQIDELQRKLEEAQLEIERINQYGFKMRVEIDTIQQNLDIAVEALKYYAKLEMREIGILHNVAEETLKKLEK